MSSWILILISFTAPSAARGVPATTAHPYNPIASPYIAIGFVGGFVKRTDRVHSVVQLAERLRKDYPSSVRVEVFENHHPELAHDAILRLLDANRDGKLSLGEKQNAHIILYGHSWGASEAVQLARMLQKDGIPVLLTVQVDSVAKPGENDSLIPANVAQAANFYQPRGLVHGQRLIRAYDPAHTQILGNYRIDYAKSPISCDSYPWWNRLFMRSHTEIECDPKVWDQVESLIRAKLPAR